MRFLTIILSLFLFAQTAISAPFNANAKTKRIPAGTQFSLQLTNPVSTYYTTEGSEFTAILVSDQSADTDVILPMGSLVRGTIKKVEKDGELTKDYALIKPGVDFRKIREVLIIENMEVNQ